MELTSVEIPKYISGIKRILRMHQPTSTRKQGKFPPDPTCLSDFRKSGKSDPCAGSKDRKGPRIEGMFVHLLHLQRLLDTPTAIPKANAVPDDVGKVDGFGGRSGRPAREGSVRKRYLWSSQFSRPGSPTDQSGEKHVKIGQVKMTSDFGLWISQVRISLVCTVGTAGPVEASFRDLPSSCSWPMCEDLDK